MTSNEGYKSYISCLGGICGFICCSYRRIETSTVGLLENFGKFKQLLEPGLHYVNPCTESVQVVELKTKVMDMPNQTVYTKDNICVVIDTAIFYRITHAYRATYRVKDVIRSLAEMTFVTMRTVCGEYVIMTQLRCCRIS
jgi:erythrocyte band 7 integral membrane protein